MRTWPALDVGALTDHDLFEAALVDHPVTAIDESAAADGCRVFFACDADRQRAAAALAHRFPALTIRALDVPDEDWVSRSQANLRAVHVGGMVVAPPWDVPQTAAVDSRHAAHDRTGADVQSPLLVVIRPSMGFGTGHHATTSLCLRALQQLDLTGRRVLDAGTGSGLLAIAASLLGAAAVVGIDDDPDALDAARDNLALNPAARVTFQRADVRAAMPAAFDVLTANLTGALLQDVAVRLIERAAPGASLVLCGILSSEEESVRAAYQACVMSTRAEEDEWVCLTLRRP